MMLTASQAAMQVGVSAATITRWCNEGVLKAQYTAGGQRRISIHELERYFNDIDLDELCEKRRAQTFAARTALALRRKGKGIEFSEEDINSFYDDEPESVRTPLMDLFKEMK